MPSKLMQARNSSTAAKFRYPPIAETEFCNQTGDPSILDADGRYEVRIARSAEEIKSALRLRFKVFKIEMGGGEPSSSGLEFDEYDFRCKHLIVRDNVSGKTVGTYRLSVIGETKGASAFYSHREFTIEDLPTCVLQNGIEIGRACVAPDHRNTKVLFLLWKALAAYLLNSKKRYFFGCCSIFTNDKSVGRYAYLQLKQAGNLHPTFHVVPRSNVIEMDNSSEFKKVKLPGLFEMYLRLGARVCGPPTADAEFGTIDFFVVFDLDTVPNKYRKIFFS